MLMYVIAELLSDLCLFNLDSLARLRVVCSTLHHVRIPMVKTLRVDCIHSHFKDRTSWLYEPPRNEIDECYQTESHIRMSVVHVPEAYPVVASEHLSVPVQCTVDGNTCWYRLVAISLGERRCKACKHKLPQSYFHLLEAVYAYSLFFADVDMDHENLPHVFCMLSPHGEAIDLEFEQLESMITARCFDINDGAVFGALAEAILNPVTYPFPLRMMRPRPLSDVDDPSSCQNMGLTTIDMEYIQRQAPWLANYVTPLGVMDTPGWPRGS